MPPDYRSRSLADAQPGDTVEILNILFEEQREYCMQQGIAPGTHAALGERADAGVRLDLPSGRSVWVDSGLARFIEIRVLEKDWLVAPGEPEPGMSVPVA